VRDIAWSESFCDLILVAGPVAKLGAGRYVILEHNQAVLEALSRYLISIIEAISPDGDLRRYFRGSITKP
jgi:hypothetical protein